MLNKLKWRNLRRKMAAIKKNELKVMSKEDAKKKMGEMKKELMKLKSQVARGTPPENPGKIRSLRRNIARMLMVMNRKTESGGGK